jgi:hypothetical protein
MIYFPDEVWVYIKNLYFQEYWYNKYKLCMKSLPKSMSFYRTIYTSAMHPIRFIKNYEIGPNHIKDRERCSFGLKIVWPQLLNKSTVIYSIYKDRRE